MKISSPSFKNNEKIPEKFTADGKNVNPRLTITEIPKGSKSLVLIVDDPDAKKVVGYTWIHWVLFNIPVKGDSVILEEDSVVGTSGQSTYKRPKYGGPNPPKEGGVHNYFFKAFALDTDLSLPSMAPLEEINAEMKNHLLAKAEMVGTYWRD